MTQKKNTRAQYRSRPDKDRRQNQATRFARILKTLLLIKARPGITVSEICEHLGVVYRTAYRDIHVLRTAGFEITSEDGELRITAEPSLNA